ncbi:MAG: hypothetical protein ACT4TC_06605 [Myxococcaceae bacterium]
MARFISGYVAPSTGRAKLFTLKGQSLCVTPEKTVPTAGLPNEAEQWRDSRPR